MYESNCGLNLDSSAPTILTSASSMSDVEHNITQVLKDEAFNVAIKDHFHLKITMSTIDIDKLSPNRQLLLQPQEMALTRKY